MNVAFINPFLESILNVLSTMAKLEATAGKPSLKKDIAARGDVTGIIGMTCEQARGSLAITFTEAVAFDIMKRMLGEDVSELNDAVTDMVGEITNMVTGGAKKLLAEQGYDFDMAIPAVVSGFNHAVTHKSKGPKVIIPFDTEAGKFFVEVCFE